jgi:hypothetical protein
MMRKNDGGPAHPVCTGNPDHWQKGMSLRDWFAGQALTGIISNPNNMRTETFGTFARDAYIFADAMLAERAKG